MHPAKLADAWPIEKAWNLVKIRLDDEKRRRKRAKNPITDKEEVRRLCDRFWREEITVHWCRSELRKLPHYCKTIIAYGGRQVRKEDLETVNQKGNIINSK